MLHAFSMDGVDLGGGVEDVAASMAISQGCKRVSSELYVQQKCEELMSGKPANEVAVGIASVAGYGGCLALGTGPFVAGLCATAAGKVTGWLLAEYTPAERAEILWRAARLDIEGAKISKLGDIHCGYPCYNRMGSAKLMQDVARQNLTLLGVPNVWTKPKEQAVSVIIMAIAAAGVGDQSILWFTRKRGVGDLPSPPRPTVASPTAPAVRIYPSGSIAAYDPAIAAYRIAAPLGLAGAATHREVATSASAPSGVAIVPLPTYQTQTGSRPWYRSWKVWAGVGVAAAAVGGGAVMLRRRR